MFADRLAQFIRYHNSTREAYTIRVFLGTETTPVQGATIHDDVATNRLLISLPNELEPIVLDVMGPANPRLNIVLFDGYTADVVVLHKAPMKG